MVKNVFFKVLHNIINFLNTIYRDFFPERRNVQDDGIHAKLNYQNIADAQRRSMSILLMVILAIAFVFSWKVYEISISDILVEQHDVKNYSEYMSTIRKQILRESDSSESESNSESENVEIDSEVSKYLSSKYAKYIENDTLIDENAEEEKMEFLKRIDSLEHVVVKKSVGKVGRLTEEEKMLEGNTSLYWGVFFTRFLLVRLLIGVTIGIIIAFLIRIYFRIRHDRAVNIHKEEALSTIQYVARGEWRLSQDEDSKEYFVPPHIDENSDEILSTQEFLKILPISTLFKAPDLKRSRRKGGGKSDKELVDTMKQIVSTLSKIEEDLKDMAPPPPIAER